MAALAADHHVYALNLRGAGRSEAPRSDYDTSILATDVLGVLEALHLQILLLRELVVYEDQFSLPVGATALTVSTSLGAVQMFRICWRASHSCIRRPAKRVRAGGRDLVAG